MKKSKNKRALVKTILIFLAFSFFFITWKTGNINFILGTAVFLIILWIYHELTLTPEERRKRNEKINKARAERERIRQIEKESYHKGKAEEKGRIAAKRDEYHRREAIKQARRTHKEIFRM